MLQKRQYSLDISKISNLRIPFGTCISATSPCCFPNKPFIVIECGTYDELINNVMDEADPFPYDLTEAELLKEVKYSLGIEPYPENC